MKVLVKTNHLSQEEWLRWRTKGIGGSDVSIIFGANPYRSIFELWREKTGQTEVELSENEFTHFGTVLEPIVKKEFAERTGLKVRAKKAILQSSEHPFMLADLDGVINLNGEMCIFEAKTASQYKREVWEKGVPFEYVLQVQHYMAVTGAKRAFVAALVGGNWFCYHEVLRDDALISQIIAREEQFWCENVLGGMEPLSDGSPATTAYLNDAYPESNGLGIELPAEALPVFERYDAVSKEFDEVKKRKEALGNQLKCLLKENESGYVADRRISWKPVQAIRLDGKRLELEKPDIYREYLTKSSYRRLTVA